MSRNISAFVLVFLVASMFLVQFAAASDAVIAYRSNTGSGTNMPRLRFWNSSGNGSWGSEIVLPNANSSVSFLVLKSYPASGKLVLVTEGNDALLDAYVCTSNCNSSGSWVVTHDIANVAEAGTNPGQRRFDVEFETSTGNALVVYAVNSTNTSRDLGYKVLPAGTSDFTGITEQYIDDSTQAGNTAYTWVRTNAKPTNSPEIVMTGFDSTHTQISAWVWNGSSWGNQIKISTSATDTSGFEGLAVRYAADGSKAMAMGANGTVGNADYATWDGSSWSSVSTFDMTPGDSTDVEWLNIKADPASTNFQAVAVCDGGSPELSAAYWNGTGWSATVVDASIDGGTPTRRAADFEWLASGSTGRLVWDRDGGGSTLSQMACSPKCNGSSSTISTYPHSGAWITLYRDPTPSDAVKILGVRFDADPDDQIGSFRFNGTNYTNYGDTVITSDASSDVREAYSLAFVAAGAVPGGPGVVVTLGSSPANNAIINYSPVNFTFTATSNASATLNCALYIDGVLSNNATVANNTLSGIVSAVTSGVHLWNVTCTDGTLSNSSATRNFTADVSPPVIVLNSPPDLYLTNSSSVTFNFTVTDDYSATMNCSIRVDGSQQAYNNNVPNNTAWTFGVGSLSDGPHSWNIVCKDLANSVVSDTRGFTVDTTPPSIALGLPTNGARPNTTSVNFSYTPTDNLAANMSCSLYVDSILRNTSVVNNGSTDTEVISPFGSGSHTWYVSCTDQAGNTNTSATWVFTIDQPPTVILNSPADGAWITSPGPANVTLTFTGVDDFGLPPPGNFTSIDTALLSQLNCQLYLDGSLNYSSDSVYNNTPVSVNFTVDIGAHSWHVICTDGSGNTGISPTYSFTVSESSQPQQSGTGGGEELKHYTITATQVCPGNQIDVYAYTSSGALVGANVREVLSDPYEGLITQDTTDETGHVTFDAGTEGMYTLTSTKIGYANPLDVELRFTYCQGEAPPQGGNATQPPPPTQPPAGTNVTPPVTPPAGSNKTNPSVGTHDQQTSNGGVTIDSVDLDKPGCAVVYTVGPDGNPQTVVGYTDVMSGNNADVNVILSGYGNQTNFVVVLYYDNGDGKCDPSTDQQVMVNGAPVLKEFRLTQPQAAAPKPPTPPVTSPTPAAANPCPLTLIIVGAVVVIALASGAYMIFRGRPRASRK